jgi:UDP:flavonoid glycosyltransferase YjiC (YdhE family)
VRFLFGFVGGTGHLAPQLPVASALAAAGHAVAFSTYFTMVPEVEAAGFEALVTGPRVAEPAVKKPLLAPDPAREDEVVRRAFAGRAARERLASVPEHCEAWRPDVLVCDETDYGAQIAAGRRGLPFASVLIGPTGAFPRREAIAAALELMPAPPGLVLSPFPPSLRTVPLPATAHPFQPCAPGHAEGDEIYFTLGTVFNLESGDLFARVLAGLRGHDVIVTVGRSLDPAELGPQPPGIRVERFVAQAEVLPRCRLVISHGGSGSLVAALAHGLPSVLIPLGADQLVNAERAAALGVARVLDAVGATADDVREAVDAVLSDERHRHAAEALRDEIAALPGPESAVEPLTRLRGG